MGFRFCRESCLEAVRCQATVKSIQVSFVFLLFFFYEKKTTRGFCGQYLGHSWNPASWLHWVFLFGLNDLQCVVSRNLVSHLLGFDHSPATASLVCRKLHRIRYGGPFISMRLLTQRIRSKSLTPTLMGQ